MPPTLASNTSSDISPVSGCKTISYELTFGITLKEKQIDP
jgi:hypothetical protein